MVTDGLVFALDNGNVKSYPGTGTTWFDLRGNVTGISLSNTTIEADGDIYFNGTTGRIGYYNWPSSLNSDDNTTPRSWEVIAKPTAVLNRAEIFGHRSIAVTHSFCSSGGIYIYSGTWRFLWYDYSSYQYLDSGIVPTPNKHYHVVGTYNTIDRKPRIYINGELKATFSSATNMDYSTGQRYYEIGYNPKTGSTDYFKGYIPVVKYYKNNALSAAEVLQNYNSLKSRFNL